MEFAEGAVLVSVVGLALVVAAPVHGFVTKQPIDAGERTSLDAGSNGSATGPEATSEVVVGVQFEDVVRAGNGTERRLDPPDGTTYFSVTPRDRGVVTSYAAKPTNCDRDATCTGFEKVYLNNGTTAWEETFGIPKIGRSEIHDVEPVGERRFVYTDMVQERVVVYDRATDRVVWQWRGEQHYGDPPANYTSGDWLHINDVDRLPDGRYMISIREKNQVLFVERGRGVTGVVNEDGTPDVLFRQHNPQWLGPGAVLVADSENDRVVELHRRGGEWRVVWELRSAGGITFDWPRDADRLPNGHTLITDSRNNRVVEVDENGTLVETWRVRGTPYEADSLAYGDEPRGPGLPTADEPRTAARGPFRVPRYADLLHAGIVQVAKGVPYWFDPVHVFVMSVGLVLAAVRPVVAGVARLARLA